MALGRRENALSVSRLPQGPVALAYLEAWAVQRDPWLGVWDDAVAVTDDWAERQLAYGLLLHRLRGKPRGVSARSPTVGEIVLWAGERDLPWVVASVNGHKISLAGPAGMRGREKKVLVASVTLLDAATALGRDVAASVF